MSDAMDDPRVVKVAEIAGVQLLPFQAEIVRRALDGEPIAVSRSQAWGRNATLRLLAAAMNTEEGTR